MLVTIIVNNLFNSRLKNSALSHRRELAIKAVRKGLKGHQSYDFFFDWESSTEDHLKFMAVHREWEITVRVHVFLTNGQVTKVLCDGPRCSCPGLWDVTQFVKKRLSARPKPAWRLA